MYADQDPFLWCDSCYREFHFVVAKKKGNEKEEEKEKEEEEEEQLSYPGFTAIPFYISKEF